MADTSFAQLARYNFDAADIRNGEAYFYSGRVKLDHQDDSCAHYKVRGSTDQPYDVIFNWRSGHHEEVASACSCRRWDEAGICKHLYAAAMQADFSGHVPAPILKWREIDLVPSDELLIEHGAREFDEAFDYEEDDFDSDQRRQMTQRLKKIPPATSGSRSQGGATSNGKRSKSASPEWQEILKKNANFLRLQLAPFQTTKTAKRPREAWFCLSKLDVQAAQRLQLRLLWREQRMNGGWGKLKNHNMNSYLAKEFEDPEDRALLELLTSGAFNDYQPYSYSSYSSSVQRVALPASMWDVLLPRLCARGRLVGMLDDTDAVESCTPLQYDSGPAYRFEMPVTRQAKNQPWRVEGRLVRGDEAIPCVDLRFVLPDGLVWIEDRLARVDLHGQFVWLALLQKHGGFEVPGGQLDDFIAQAWQFSSEPPLVLPDETNWKFAQIEPAALVRFKPHRYDKNKLSVSAEFHYGDIKIDAQAITPCVVKLAEKQIIRRDRDREQSRLSELSSAGVAAENYYGSPDSIGVFPLKRLGDAVPRLIGKGWQVEAEGKLIRSASNFKFNVTTGVDWFDLEGECRFDDQVVMLPELLKALRQGKNYVKLDDGTQGMLPQQWLDKFGSLVNLGEADGDTVRFRRSQGMLLDALLASQESVALDAAFKKFRNRIANFEGITPGKEPKSFQGELREYQRVGLGWFDFLAEFGLGGCLADDMGLGKTIQVLALLEARRAAAARSKQPSKSSVIVVPRSLVHNWLEEAAKFTPKLRVADFSGAARGESLPSAESTDLIVTTYGILRQDIELFAAEKFDYAILDEAQAIKNSDSQAAKASRLLQADHRLALTGTPVENRLAELWSIVEFINPGMLGHSQSFRSALGSRGTDDDALAIVARAVRPILLRRTKEQVLKELPQKTEQTLYCELDTQQRRLYNELRDHYRAALEKKIKDDGLARSKIVVLEALLRLRQAACHPGLLDKKRIKDPSSKLDCLLEQLREVTAEGHKVLVFSQFTSLLSLVEKKFAEEKISYVYLDGKTRKRQEVVDQFQNDPSVQAFLISLKAGGVGLNLTAADYVFILDPWWNPAVEAQAVDRAHRIGQHKPVFAYRLIARDTVEEKILQLQGDKRRLAEAIVSADDSVIRQLTAEDLQLLLS